METLHPGVYIQEVSSGVRPIEGASTSTAAFIGRTEKGPTDRALMVTSFTEFETIYGGFLQGYFLAQSALQFFNNGGKRLYVARVARLTDSDTKRIAQTASITLADRETTPTTTLKIEAISPGAWGNTLMIDIADGSQDPGDDFKLVVNQEVPGVPHPIPLESYDNLSLRTDSPNFVERAINGKSKYIRVSVTSSGSTTARGTSRSGAGAQTTLPSGNQSLTVNVNEDGPQTVQLANPTTTGPEIATAIQTAVRSLTPQRGATSKDAYSNFTANFAAGTYTLTSGDPGSDSSVEVTNAPANNAAALLKLGKTNTGIEQSGESVLKPAIGINYLVGDGKVGRGIIEVVAGQDGADPEVADYQNGFVLLDRVTDVNIIAVPGVKSLVNYGASYCDNRGDCFFVGDMGVDDDEMAEAQDFVNGLAAKSSYAAVYFPWIYSTDPSGRSTEPIPLPPSGFVTGLYARTDARRGVWKAPAGTEANLGGALRLTVKISDAEQDMLNPIGVNVIRQFDASGIVIWGARTLATRANPEYRYVPVRRTAIFLEQSIYNGIQWAVFEPNDEGLWASLRLNIGAFMMLQFRAGAFQGKSASDAFFVQCDSKTTTQADIDAGIVNILVGFAPLKPAEFVVLRLTQKAGPPAA